MRIKLLTTMAGPDGCFSAGSIVDLPAMTANPIVAGGFAVAVENPLLRESPLPAVAGETVSADGSVEGAIGGAEAESAAPPVYIELKRKRKGR